MKIVKISRMRKIDVNTKIPEEIKRQYEFTDWLANQEFSKNEVKADFVRDYVANGKINVWVRLLGKTGGNRFTQSEFSAFAKTIAEIKTWSDKVMETAKSKFPDVDFKRM